MTKGERKLVYEKYNGHCAYCGCELEYKDMQVDHIDSKYRFGELRGEDVDRIENYMPSCRMCNFYKSTYTIEEFRAELEKLLSRMAHGFDFRLAKKYGLIEEKPRHIQFYYEEQEKRAWSAYYESFCRHCLYETLTSEMMNPYPCGKHCCFHPNRGLLITSLIYGHGRRTNGTGGEQDA